MNAPEKRVLSGIRGVIVDLDGTMVHTAPDFQVAINRMRAELDLAPLSVETVISFVGKGSEHLMRRVLAVDVDADPSESLTSRHWKATSGTTKRSMACTAACMTASAKAL